MAGGKKSGAGDAVGRRAKRAGVRESGERNMVSTDSRKTEVWRSFVSHRVGVASTYEQSELVTCDRKLRGRTLFAKSRRLISFLLFKVSSRECYNDTTIYQPLCTEVHSLKPDWKSGIEANCVPMQRRHYLNNINAPVCVYLSYVTC